MELTPAMLSEAPVTWAEARWVGSLDLRLWSGHAPLTLQRADGYRRARLLVREGAAIRGFVDVAIDGRAVHADEVHAAVARLPAVEQPSAAPTLPTISVVVCTRDRPEQLRGALRAILALDYPHFDVVVVDNAASTPSTSQLIREEFADPKLRLVDEPIAGLAQARNTGVAHATGEIVAFTDDDVVVDPSWLHELAVGFDRADDVDCVTGLVPSGELRTPVQAYFDGRVSWANNLRTRTFTLIAPPDDLPMFPFCIGEFGTGANFALRRSAVLALGGFDTAFGVGTRTGGGEDIDMFTRVILSGSTLVVQPSATVWHRHRDDIDALRVQARGYGTGLGAWLTKILLDPRTARMALRRSPHAIARLVSLVWRKPEGVAKDVSLRDAVPPRQALKVGWLEFASIARGPLRYWKQRRDGAGPGLSVAAHVGSSRDLEAVEASTIPSGTPDVPVCSEPLACIVLAHSDPDHVRRLITALHPFPVFLHIDSRTPEPEYQAMITDLPERCSLLERRATGWGRWENVLAEIDGYRAALRTTEATHFALLTGTDYPLAPADEISTVLAENQGSSIAHVRTMPYSEWGQSGGISRIRFRHWVWRKHMVRLPIPRRLPREIVLAAGSQPKIIARTHAQSVVRTVDEEPGLARFWRRTWIPDETFIPSLLSTPRIVENWLHEHLETNPWWIGWDEARRKSPPWLGAEHQSAVLSRLNYPNQTFRCLFARKFHSAQSASLLAAIDRQRAGQREHPSQSEQPAISATG